MDRRDWIWNLLALGLASAIFLVSRCANAQTPTSVRITNSAGTAAAPVSSTTGLTVNGTVTATNPAVGSTGAAVPTSATYIGLSNLAGTLVGPLVFDLDSAGGTEWNIGVTLRLSSSGGSIEAIGQKLMASSIPVTIASNQSTLNVACTSGCSGSSFADNSAFSFGTTVISPGGLVYDDIAPNAATENSAAAPRMSQNRVAYSQIRDAAGNERGVNVTVGNALTVDGSATTQPISGTVTVTDGAGSLNVIVDSSALPSGAATAAAQTDKSQFTKITDGTDTALITGTGLLQVDGSGVTQPVSGTVTVTDGAGALNVIVDSGAITTVGTITNALPVGSNVIGKVSIDQTTPGTTNLVQVTDGAGVLNTIIDSGTLTAVTSITNTVSSNIAQVNGQTVNVGTGAAGTGTQRVTTSTDSSIRITDGTDTAQVTATSGGSLQVECTSGCGGAATFNDNSAFTPGTTSVTNIGAEVDDVATTAVAENSAGAPRMSVRREMYQQIRDAAGNERGVNVTAGNALVVDGSAVTQPISGTVTVTDGAGALNVIVDSGTVTTVSSVTAVGTITPGTAATSLGKAEDTVHSTGDVGVASLGVINTGGATFAADGDYSPLATNTLGHVMTDQRTIVGTAVAVNNGAVSAGVQRVTIANDSTGKLATVDTITNPVTVTDGAGALNVIVDSSALPSGASTLAEQQTQTTSLQLIDDAIYASDAAISKVAGIGGQFDDTAPGTTTENSVRALRMSTRRELYGQIRDAAGNERGANVTAGNALVVDGSASTQPISGTVTVTDGAGALNVIVDSGTITAVTGITNALPVGANVIGKVSIDQATPGTTNLVQVTDGAGALNTIVDSGTLTAVTSITNTVTVAGNLTTNNAAPAGTNIGALVATATVAPPTAATEGRQVLLSTDLIGGLRVNPAAGVSATQTEVLVLASASTAVPTTPLVGRKAVEIQNLGPNAIFCKPGGTGAVNTTRKIASGGTWAFDAGDAITVGCRAATADQSSGAATVVTELK